MKLTGTKNQGKTKMRFPLHPLIFVMLATSPLALTACSAVDRLENVGAKPALSKVSDPRLEKGYAPVTMPMPEQQAVTRQANSLWSGDKKGIFKDQRADDIGDILTVVININDKGEINNETSRSRTSNEDVSVGALAGFESYARDYLPDAVDPTNLGEASSGSSHRGSGEIDREEKINLRLAALVTQVLPNGNMVIQGSQEVRVNYENRILKLAGVIRPEDIGVDNAISYDKIAEARVSYGGKGQITDVQQPRYGQQVFDVLMPF
jgi:flagellar L-ring protein FlgH